MSADPAHNQSSGSRGMPPSLPDSPPATRLTAPSWLDRRLVIGVALVAISAFLGAQIVARADDSERMWTVRSDLAEGTVLESDDLVATDVQLREASGSYFSADTKLSGRRLTRDVAAGELVPKDVVSTKTCGSVISLPVTNHHLPPTVDKGDLISVYVTPEEGAEAEQVLDGVAVQRVVKPKSGLLSASAQWSLTVRVPAAKAAQVVSSARSDLDVAVVGEGEDTDPCGEGSASQQSFSDTEETP